jgi:hypothetical protein
MVEKAIYLFVLAGPWIAIGYIFAALICFSDYYDFVWDRWPAGPWQRAEWDVEFRS